MWSDIKYKNSRRSLDWVYKIPRFLGFLKSIAAQHYIYNYLVPSIDYVWLLILFTENKSFSKFINVIKLKQNIRIGDKKYIILKIKKKSAIFSMNILSNFKFVKYLIYFSIFILNQFLTNLIKFMISVHQANLLYNFLYIYTNASIKSSSIIDII